MSNLTIEQLEELFPGDWANMGDFSGIVRLKAKEYSIYYAGGTYFDCYNDVNRTSESLIKLPEAIRWYKKMTKLSNFR